MKILKADALTILRDKLAAAEAEVAQHKAEEEQSRKDRLAWSAAVWKVLRSPAYKHVVPVIDMPWSCDEQSVRIKLPAGTPALPALPQSKPQVCRSRDARNPGVDELKGAIRMVELAVGDTIMVGRMAGLRDLLL